jgi:hypothetical protein
MSCSPKPSTCAEPLKRRYRPPAATRCPASWSDQAAPRGQGSVKQTLAAAIRSWDVSANVPSRSKITVFMHVPCAALTTSVTQRHGMKPQAGRAPCGISPCVCRGKQHRGAMAVALIILAAGKGTR